MKLTKAEINEYVRMAQALTREEAEVVVSQMPDDILMHELMHRYMVLRDIRDAHENADRKIGKMYDRYGELEDVEFFSVVG